MGKVWALLLQAVLWLFGIGREKSKDERHEDMAKDLGKAEEKVENLEAAMEAVKNAQDVEDKMKDQQQKDSQEKPKKKAKSGDKLFIFLLLVCLTGCAHHVNNSPTQMSLVCPEIPLPSKPKLPDMTIPEQNVEGNYCFSQEEMNAVVQGISDLKEYSLTLEKTVEIYNSERKSKK